jgi:hypothetical protein
VARNVTVPHKKTLVAADTGHFVGIVGAGYKVFTNEQAVTLCHKFCLEAFPDTTPAEWTFVEGHGPGTRSWAAMDIHHRAHAMNLWGNEGGASEIFTPFRVDLQHLLKIRLLVLALGQKDAADWWSCSFLNSAGGRFLASPFPRSAFWAACHASSIAAARHHDERIGTGGTVHLFRLGQEVEIQLRDKVLNDGWRPDFEPSATRKSCSVISSKLPSYRIRPRLSARFGWRRGSRFARCRLHLGFLTVTCLI